MAKICSNLGTDACTKAAAYSAMEPAPLQSRLHYAYDALENRFQEFAPNFKDGQKVMPLVDISTIDKVPVAMWVGEADDLCSYDHALEIQK